MLTNEHDEIQRLEAAITTIKSQITELNPVSNLIQKEPKPNKLNNELYYKNSSVENIDKTEQITKIDSSSKFEIKPESTVKTSTTSSDAITPLASITKRIKTRSRR